MEPWYFPAAGADLGETFVFGGAYYFCDVGWQFEIATSIPSGYTHPTLSNATATDITATSFRPRVTYTFS